MVIVIKDDYCVQDLYEKEISSFIGDISMGIVDGGRSRFFVEARPSNEKAKTAKNVRLIWLHGWAQNRQALVSYAVFFERLALNYFVDLPGFGDSPPPADSWGSKDYAVALAEWLKKAPQMPTVIIGYSLGGLIGIQLAAHYPSLIDGLIIIAGSGLKKKRSVFFKLRVWRYKIVSKMVRLVDAILRTSLLETLNNRSGSTDYRRAGVMRLTLVKIVNEDISDVARQVQQQVLLIYGKEDKETPAEFGHRFKDLIPKSELKELSGLDHWSILNSGKHQISFFIRSFIDRIQ
jgi:pimeloyl-ACP methyl ester carboxylesterase